VLVLSDSGNRTRRTRREHDYEHHFIEQEHD